MNATEIKAIIDPLLISNCPTKCLNVRAPGSPDPEVRLRPGDVIQHESVAVVDMVNECRARCTQLGLSKREFTHRFSDKPVVFIKASSAQFSISTVVPSSRILARLGSGWEKFCGKSKPKSKINERHTRTSKAATR